MSSSIRPATSTSAPKPRCRSSASTRNADPDQRCGQRNPGLQRRRWSGHSGKPQPSGGIAFDTQGNLYIEDQDNNLIRKVTPAGIITTVAGNPATINQGLPTYGGDGGPATQAGLALCCSGVYASYDSITVDAAGNLYIGDSGHHVVRKVTTDGIIHTVAGNNALGGGFAGDGGAATSAQLNWPMGVFVDPAGDLYIADFSNNCIRKVDASTQTITTVAGSGMGGSATSGPATQVSLNGPQKIVLDGKGNLYIADTKSYLARKVDLSPTLTFPTSTTVGAADTTDGPLGVVLANIGNAPLTLPPPTSGLNPSASVGFTLYTGESGACSGPSSPAGTLAQGSTCALQVNFAPVAAGSVAGSLVVSDNSLNAAGPPASQTITLADSATPAPAPVPVLTPSALTFGSLTVGTTSTAQTARLQNTGNASLAISSFGFFGTNPGSFSETDNCGTSLAAGASCSISVFCTPATVGPLSASWVRTSLRIRAAVGHAYLFRHRRTRAPGRLGLSYTSLRSNILPGCNCVSLQGGSAEVGVAIVPRLQAPGRSHGGPPWRHHAGRVCSYAAHLHLRDAAIPHAGQGGLAAVRRAACRWLR